MMTVKILSFRWLHLSVLMMAVAFAMGCESARFPERSSPDERRIEPFMGMGERWTDRDWRAQNDGRESEGWNN